MSERTCKLIKVKRLSGRSPEGAHTKYSSQTKQKTAILRLLVLGLPMRMKSGWPSRAQYGPSWRHLGSNLAPISANWAPSYMFWGRLKSAKMGSKRFFITRSSPKALQTLIFHVASDILKTFSLPLASAKKYHNKQSWRMKKSLDRRVQEKNLHSSIQASFSSFNSVCYKNAFYTRRSKQSFPSFSYVCYDTFIFTCARRPKYCLSSFSPACYKRCTRRSKHSFHLPILCLLCTRRPRRFFHPSILFVRIYLGTLFYTRRSKNFFHHSDLFVMISV